MRTALPPILSAPSIASGELRMDQAYALAGQLAQERFDRLDPTLFPRLRGLAPENLLVVNGCYDRIQHVFDGLRLPYVSKDSHEVTADALRGAKAVFVNCGNAFHGEAAQRIARFVESGGLLLTTDWGLSNVIEPTMPGYLEANGRSTPNDVVALDDVADAEFQSPLTQDFRGERPAWWLEANSRPFLRSPKATVLLSSREMRAKYGNGSVAATFRHGAGDVYHMVSHFYLQQVETKEPTQNGAASAFAEAWDASERTLYGVKILERTVPGFNFASLQAASTSTMFLMRILEKHLVPREGLTGIASGTSVFRMLMAERRHTGIVQWPTEFTLDPKNQLRRYRFPAEKRQATLGRHSDTVILGDPTLKRRHATIERLGDGENTFRLTAHGLVTIRRGEDIVTYDHGEQAFLLPGDHVLLTPDVAFLFDPIVK